MYATPGIQDYVLPFRILRDTTDRGPLWDPLLNIYSYHYNTTLADGNDRSIRTFPSSSSSSPHSNDLSDVPADPLANTLTPTTHTPYAPISFFHYRGHWGDKYLPRTDKRQYALGSEKAYVSGPFGPRAKALGRVAICPFEDKCDIKDSIAPRNWGLRIFIDYLIAVGIFWALLGCVWGVVRCVGCVKRRRAGGERKGDGADGNGDVDGEGEATERTRLLGGENRVGSRGE